MDILMGCMPYIIVAFILIAGVIVTFKGEKKSLKDVLLYLCTEAEKIYGNKTGQLKLQYVWSQACKQFKFLTTFLTFEIFSNMVDECLVNLRHLLQTNKKMAEYVGVEKKDDAEDIKCEGTE